MPRLGLSASLTAGNSGAIGAGVIWKVAIFGAGTASSNGEYVWDGTTTFNGENVYSGPAENQIAFVDGLWYLYDSSGGDDTYTSENLIAWDILAGLSPAPSSAFSYAQDSFISSITLTDANIATSNGTYSRISGSTTQFDKVGSTNFIFNDGVWIVADYDEGTDTYQSNDLFVWSSNLPEFDPPPIVSAMVYSA